MESTVEEYSTYLPLGTQEEHDAWMDSEGFAPVRVIPHEAYIEYVWDNPLAYSYSIDAGANNMPLGEDLSSAEQAAVDKSYPSSKAGKTRRGSTYGSVFSGKPDMLAHKEYILRHHPNQGEEKFLNKQSLKALKAQKKPALPEETVNEISLKTKVDAYTLAKDPEFDYYADGTHNPDRKMGQADRIRAAIARKHGEEEAIKADNAADYAHYGDYMFKEPLEELSDKRLNKYVKKASKSAKTLKYYSDSRNDPDYEKAVKRERMVDVAKRKLGEDVPAPKVTAWRMVVDMVDAFNNSIGGNAHGPLDVKDRGTKVWTRGDGVRYKDPGYIRLSPYMNPADTKKWEKINPVAKFWEWLKQQPGVHDAGEIRGEFGSNPRRQAVGLKGLFFAMNSGSATYIEWGSKSRYKNPRSVWHVHKPVTEAAQQEDVIHNLAARLAAKYRANEYEEFEQEMLNFLPQELRGKANIPELFDLYNPHRQREGGEIWARMLKNPERYLK